MSVTRDDIIAVIHKHAMETIEDVTPEQLESAQSLIDIGANSLDVVEIVSLSMRELKVKVPREELMKVDSMDGLIDLLHGAVKAKEAAAEGGPAS